MREIKFRGYGTDDKKRGWIYGNLLIEKIVDLVCIQDENCHVWEVEPESVGEYTGLQDSKGNEIFEGDILTKRDELAWRTVDRGVVFWHNGECRWCVEMRDGLVFSLTSRKSDTWRVIGNSYDNSELLKD